MPSLFEPISFGNMQFKNQFVHFAAYESLALEAGEVTDQLINRYKNVAKGEVGLIIPDIRTFIPWEKLINAQPGFIGTS